MSMSFIAGAAAAITIGGLVIGGLAVAPGDGGFEEIRIEQRLGARHALVPAIGDEAEHGFARTERYGERFRYAD